MKPAVKPFRGMMPILPTVVNVDGEVDVKGMQSVVDYCLSYGAVAIGHFGFASEFVKLTDDQRTQLTEIILERVAKRVPVFIGVTANSNHAAAKYAREAQSLGADLLMAMPPYIGQMNQRSVYDYYRAITDLSDLPLIIQDAQSSAAVLKPEFIVRMFEEFPSIQYVKAEGGDFLTKTARINMLSGHRMPVIGGWGGRHMIHMLRNGVTAFMTGTEALDIHGDVVRAYLAGDENKAAELYYNRMLPYLMIYDMYPEYLLKYLLHARGIIQSSSVILPCSHEPVDPLMLKELEWTLQRIGFLKPLAVYQKVTALQAGTLPR